MPSVKGLIELGFEKIQSRIRNQSDTENPKNSNKCIFKLKFFLKIDRDVKGFPLMTFQYFPAEGADLVLDVLGRGGALQGLGWATAHLSFLIFFFQSLK